MGKLLGGQGGRASGGEAKRKEVRACHFKVTASGANAGNWGALDKAHTDVKRALVLQGMGEAEFGGLQRMSAQLKS